MKCPKCGDYIPDEAMYCPSCGEEIKIVPDFDPLVENRIDESLSDLANNLSDTGELSEDEDYYDEEDDDDFDSHEEGHIFGSYKVTICIMCIILITLLGSIVYYLINADTSSGNKNETPSVTSATSITDSADEAESLDESGSQTDGPAAPEFSVASGTYDEVIEVYIEAGEGSIYYTINGVTPTLADSIFNGVDPIVFDKNGIYTLQAILVDNDGVKSEVASVTYEIAMPVPDAPTIIEDSGNYNVDTQIAVVTAEGTNVYYTTDGTDPTATSTLYTGPVSMPYGDSVFKFVAIDNETGAASEIVERTYSLHYTVSVTQDQAASLLIAQLVEKGYLLDGSGAVAGKDGYNTYSVTSTEVISSGDYYVFTEYYMATDGSVTPTGLLYAVNEHDGSVYRLGTDATGSYFLKQLS
ncbi:MAG: chitobiase/beta-hexosaminidase C-terminal domain-containing protein [Butyrivibrio sp.]|uniref:chitobiase/beta-hexosaminidase C-terminal domain-containing protein n=1 Tax=Butyrivibrio sp. TaxID=28121 RepID=UPI0025E7CC7C|nr:chitobiase/beta-hexosaminidase C-terminal domain-containing protein [Butyrivibrio sp.]MCR5770147.1 chitobiase/beta-hexosaminidase C-terminal domain-containing protein [Butyrivibrio sp.]